MRSVFVSKDVDPVELKSQIPESGFQHFPNAKELVPMEVDTPGENRNLDDVRPMKLDTVILRASATDGNARKSAPLCKFRCKIYKLVEIVANFNQISAMPYPLQKVADMQTKKVRIFTNCDGFHYIRYSLIVTVCSMLESDNKFIEALLVND